MKVMIITIGALLLAVAVVLFYRDTLSLSSLGGGEAAPAMLTSEQVAALKTELIDKTTGKGHHFNAAFKQLELTDSDRKAEYKKAGVLPYRIVAELMEIKNVGDRELTKRMSGTVCFYILDSTGAVADQGKEPLDKMCPS